MRQKQIPYLQWLRCFAVVGVVVIHVCSGPWNDTGEHWTVVNVFDGLARWPVPVFVMISGALFLGRERPLKKLYGTYILRILAALVFWSGIYTLVSWREGTEDWALLREFLCGHYHLWYLYFLCGLYMISPFLGKIARDDRLCSYFLALSLVFGNLLPRLADGAALVSPELGELASALLGRVKIYYCMGYVFQFVLGYRLSVREFSRRERGMIYALGILGAAVTVFGTAALTAWKGTPTALLYEPQSLHVSATAAAIFVFARYNLKSLPRAVERLAGCSFGIYLSHVLLIEALERAGISALSVSPALMIPALTVLVTAVCWGLTALLKRIPWAGRYLV